MLISISIPNVITIGLIALLWIALTKWVLGKVGVSTAWL